jgi:AcrR family transcriptional regulator
LFWANSRVTAYTLAMTTHSDDSARATRRPRGRPRKSAGTPVDARTSIVRAAMAEFAARGYDATSLRAIARRAEVDPSLVHHYFDDKADLFAASIEAPVRPDRLAAHILEGPRERIGEGLVRALLTALEEPKARARIVSLIHTALGQEFAATLLRQFLTREVLDRIAATVGGGEAELRASLAASQMVGLIVARYGIRVEPLASASIEQVVARVGPVVQWHLTGIPPSSAPSEAPHEPERTETLDSGNPTGQ